MLYNFCERHVFLNADLKEALYKIWCGVNRLFSQYLSDSTNVKNSLFLNPVTEDEIVRVVAQLKPKKSKGHDELDMCLIKKLIPYIVVPLKHIFKEALYRIWCGMNRLGDSGAKVV